MPEDKEESSQIFAYGVFCGSHHSGNKTQTAFGIKIKHENLDWSLKTFPYPEIEIVLSLSQVSQDQMERRETLALQV